MTDLAALAAAVRAAHDNPPAPAVRWPGRPTDGRPAWCRDVAAPDPWADLYAQRYSQRIDEYIRQCVRAAQEAVARMYDGYEKPCIEIPCFPVVGTIRPSQPE